MFIDTLFHAEYHARDAAADLLRDAFTHGPGPPNILRFRGPRAKFRKTSELQVPL